MSTTKPLRVRYNRHWDLETIPDAALWSEVGRRNAKKRQSYSGGVYWAEHNPKTLRCRCRECMDRREVERAERAKLPKRPPGRPPKVLVEQPKRKRKAVEAVK